MNIDKRRLLLIDDDEMARDFMTVRLSRRGFSVLAVESGLKALDVLKAREFDLVLTDMMMPGLSGYETLLEIRKLYSMLELPVIMVTSVDQEESIIKSLQAGANDYLVKPLNLEIALARINSQLTLKHLSSFKEEFLAFASHDLKKPIMLMLDIAQEMQKNISGCDSDNKEACADLGLLIKTCENMDEVIQGFLEFETLSSGQLKLEKKAINLNDIITGFIKSNDSYARKKGVSLSSELCDDLPLVTADVLRIGVVVENLIGNALKFSPPDSHVVVRSRLADETVFIEVNDQGPGLNENDMDLLFVKHAKLSNKPTGDESSTGLGLAICKQLIGLHGGDIGAKNNTGDGITFWFSLPVKNND